jgi:hypothetical protein
MTHHLEFYYNPDVLLNKKTEHEELSLFAVASMINAWRNDAAASG